MQTMNITPSSRNNRHLILFKVAPYNFCAPAAEVESIIMLPPVSRLPKVPPSVIGLINHRGQVYRVISLRRKLGLETGPPRMEGQRILTSLPTGLTAFREAAWAANAEIRYGMFTDLDLEGESDAPGELQSLDYEPLTIQFGVRYAF